MTSASQPCSVKGEATLDAKAHPVPISARLSVLNVVEVDSVKQTFIADIVCHAWAPLKELGSDTKACPEWLNVELDQKDTISSDSKGCWCFRGRKTFSEALELRNFPFDCQKLSFVLAHSLPTIRVEGDEGTCAALEPLMTSEISSQEACTIHADRLAISTEWVYLGYTVDTELSPPENSRWKRQFTNLTFSLCFIRKPVFYLWNIVAPTAVLTSLGWVVFTMDPVEWVGDRISITVTLLLTSAAYKIIVAQSLPAVPYLTLLDIYVLASFSFLVLITVASGVAHVVEDPLVDTIAASVLAGLWVLTNAVLAVWGVQNGNIAIHQLGPMHMPLPLSAVARNAVAPGAIARPTRKHW